MEEVINRFGQTPGNQNGARILKIYTLGRFQVCLGNRFLFDGAGRSHKLGDLLMYLITNRGKHVSPETILETIWPEHEYLDPRNVLKNMIYRLKQSFERMQLPGAKSYISYAYGGYSWNTSAPYWLDADEFENLCQEARSLIRNDPFRAAAKYREALSLYHGHYLLECHQSPWVLPRRYHYRSLFVRSVFDLFTFEKEHRLFSQLAEDAEWALSIEDFDESINLFYMEALLEEGKTAQARAHYEYITALNYYESGSKPSPAMQRIYKAIKVQSEKAALDFNDLRQMLIENDRSKGALLCEPESFRLFCSMERRRSERGKYPVQLGLLTLSSSGSPAAAFLSHQKKAMECLRTVLLGQLRRSDIISPWNETQYTVLLPGLSPEQAEALLQRIREAFKIKCVFEDVSLRSSVHSFFTPEMSAS